MKQLTASEVRRTASEWSNWRVGDMLRAFADLLEADEKAAPMAWANPGDLANRCFVGINVVKAGHPDLGRHYTQPLFTHPAPADAERLAEALRNLVEASHYADAPDEHEAAEAALAAHSAQAQPPAASVTDAMVNAAMRADFCGHNVADALMCGTDWTTEVMRAALEAALAAQENPNG